MDKNIDTKYIFWLRNWRDPSISFLLKTGYFKCVITRRKLSVTSVDNDPKKELNVDVSLIRKCKITPNSQISNQTVEVFTDGRKISLYPVTPFDPYIVLIGNHAEASALLNTIDALRSNIDPQVDPNPYLRQLSTKDKFISHNALAQSGMRAELIRFESLNQKWDAHISPWAHYDLFGDKFLRLKTFGKIMIQALLWVSIAITIVFVIFYILFTLNIL